MCTYVLVLDHNTRWGRMVLAKGKQWMCKFTCFVLYVKLCERTTITWEKGQPVQLFVCCACCYVCMLCLLLCTYVCCACCYVCMLCFVQMSVENDSKLIKMVKKKLQKLQCDVLEKQFPFYFVLLGYLSHYW